MKCLNNQGVDFRVLLLALNNVYTTVVQIQC